MQIKFKNYYVVEVKFPESDWGIHFGDYDRQTALDEKRDVLEGNEHREPGDKVQARMIIKKVTFDQYLKDVS